MRTRTHVDASIIQYSTLQVRKPAFLHFPLLPDSYSYLFSSIAGCARSSRSSPFWRLQLPYTQDQTCVGFRPRKERSDEHPSRWSDKGQRDARVAGQCISCVLWRMCVACGLRVCACVLDEENASRKCQSMPLDGKNAPCREVSVGISLL